MSTTVKLEQKVQAKGHEIDPNSLSYKAGDGFQSAVVWQAAQSRPSSPLCLSFSAWQAMHSLGVPL